MPLQQRHDEIVGKYNLDHRISLFPPAWQATIRAQVDKMYDLLTGKVYDARLVDAAHAVCACRLDAESSPRACNDEAYAADTRRLNALVQTAQAIGRNVAAAHVNQLLGV